MAQQVVRTQVIRSWDVTDDRTVVAIPAEVGGRPARPAAAPALDPLADLKRHAGELKAQAQAEAEAIRQAARTDADRIRAAAREEGYAAGQAAAREELGRQMAQLTAVNAELAELRTALAERFTEAGLELACALAERILRATVQHDPLLLGRMLLELLEPLQPLASLSIHCHPADAALLEQGRNLIEGQLSGGGLVLRTDPALQPGTLHCRYEGGDLDASLHTQLVRLRAGILRQLTPGAELGARA